jgi:hypothetical protein
MADAPGLKLTAVGSERSFSLQAPGVATVLICLAQETEKDAAPIESAVRALYPDPRDVLIAHVIDLRNVPGLFRKVAEGILSSEHKKAVEALTDGQDPADHVIILPDWQGEVAKSLNLPEPSKIICGAVLSAEGDVMGTYEGTDAKNVLMLIDYALQA